MSPIGSSPWTVPLISPGRTSRPPEFTHQSGLVLDDIEPASSIEPAVVNESLKLTSAADDLPTMAKTPTNPDKTAALTSRNG